MKKFIIHLKNTLLIITTAITIFIIFELFLTGIYENKNSKEFSNEKSDAHLNDEWASEYYKEIRKIVNPPLWFPYVHSRINSGTGKYININEEGIRKTWNPNVSTPTLKIFMFGGSTMWGYGSRDEFTIPSLVSKKLAERRINAEITNYAVNGDMSTQGVIRLIFELRKGRIPGLVVLYGGWIDAMSACYQKKYDAPLSNPYFEKVYSEIHTGHSIKNHFFDYIKNLHIAKFSTDIYRFFNEKKSLQEPHMCGLPIESSLPDGSLNTYLNNVVFVKRISISYGFKSLFYLEPQLADKKHRTKQEDITLQKGTFHRLGVSEFYSRARDAINKKQKNLYGAYVINDLSEIFSNTSNPIYVDSVHYGEAGNEIIAEKIVNDILSIHTMATPDSPPVQMD